MPIYIWNPVFIREKIRTQTIGDIAASDDAFDRAFSGAAKIDGAAKNDRGRFLGACADINLQCARGINESRACDVASE